MGIYNPLPGLGICTATALLLVACSTSTQKESDRDVLRGAELSEMISSGQAPAVIDVRSGYEYSKGHVPEAIHLPFWKAFTHADKLDLPHEQPVVVYCEHGPRAGIARLALKINGFENILYLEGHMNGWRKAGLPVQRGDGS